GARRRSRTAVTMSATAISANAAAVNAPSTVARSSAPVHVSTTTRYAAPAARASAIRSALTTRRAGIDAGSLRSAIVTIWPATTRITNCTGVAARTSTTTTASDSGRGARPAGRSSTSSPMTRAAVRIARSGTTESVVVRTATIRTERFISSGSVLLRCKIAEAGGTGPDDGRRRRKVDDVDFVPGTVPLAACLDGRNQRLHARRVELYARFVAKLLERDLLGERTAIGAGRGHGIEGVGDGDDARLDRRVRVGAAPLRRLGLQARRDRREKVDAAHELDRDVLVAPHPVELLLGQPAGFVEDLVRHDELADVVHQCCVAESLELGRLHLEPTAHVLRELRHALDMARGVPVLRLERADERRQCGGVLRAQLHVARERLPRDEDRRDEQRHDPRTQRQVHASEQDAEQRERVHLPAHQAEALHELVHGGAASRRDRGDEERE